MGNRRTHTLTTERRNEMIGLFRAGAHAADLAEQFDVRPGYVYVAASRAGFTRTDRTFPTRRKPPKRRLIGYAGRED